MLDIFMKDVLFRTTRVEGNGLGRDTQRRELIDNEGL